MLTVGSLFSGIGGFELGLERTGCFKTSWQCEKDEFCLKVLATHWPDVKRFTDIKEMGIEENIPYVDVICGGFPCQDISCAGKGAGIHAERSGLWWEMLRIIRLVGPRYVVVENVAEILINGAGEVLSSLSESGYNAEWQIIRASDFGLPHRRKRFFLVAYPKSEHGAEAGLLFQSGIWNPARDATWDRCKDKFRGLFGMETWNEEDARRANGGEPLICRKNDGVPRRMDRLRALGNAIVPQCAEYVGRCILEAEARQ